MPGAFRFIPSGAGAVVYASGRFGCFPLGCYAAQLGKVWPMAKVSESADSGLGR
jgi:hypothetical protein